ncbi:MAG: response regulator [Planctomycetota bacterium]
MIDARPTHFLLAEDDPDHVVLVKRAMRSARIVNTIDVVNDGVETMEYLRREGEFADAPRPDVILLDLKMPKIDGLEVLRRVKSDPELSVTPVVMMTTSDAESDRARAYEHRANSYLVKPLEFDQFQDMVRQLSMYWTIWNQPPPALLNGATG